MGRAHPVRSDQPPEASVAWGLSNHHCEAYTASSNALLQSLVMRSSLRSPLFGHVGTTLLALHWSGAVTRPGSGNKANEQLRSHGNLGGPVVSMFNTVKSRSILWSSFGCEKTAIRNIVLRHGIAERRQRSDARGTSGSQSVLIVPQKQVNSKPNEEPGEGSETSEF